VLECRGSTANIVDASDRDQLDVDPVPAVAPLAADTR